MRAETDDCSTYPFPTKAITQLAWKPSNKEGGGKMELAIASEDSSLRVYSIDTSSS